MWREHHGIFLALTHLSDYIESLPLVNTPEVFGLNPNAEIGYFTKAAKNIWHHMVRKPPGYQPGGVGERYVSGAGLILDPVLALI